MASYWAVRTRSSNQDSGVDLHGLDDPRRDHHLSRIGSRQRAWHPWGAVNGVTYYANHTRGFSTTTQEIRLTAAWFVAGHALKSKAVKAACEIAGLKYATVAQ
jgi:hypothetical protein